MKFKKVLFLASLMVLPMMNFLQAQDWADLARYQKANMELGPAKEGEDRIVFMGNSITEGWSKLSPEFFADPSYINRGISGQTTPQMLLRFKQDVIDLRPKVVVILAGTNDIAGNTGPSSQKMIQDNIFSMAELAVAYGIKVVISSVLPVYDYPWKKGLDPSQKIIDLNAALKSYSEKNGHVYLDYFTPMVDDRNGLKEAYTYDGVHPDENGYKAMAPLAKEAIAKALE
ncbi:MAG: SGNH/GDSL hydrolase family protein [Sediminicola sp.]|tara:strand:- start:27474 stop:28160 length:687 start_codon:yes stop_codon:yes gene_type:complete